MLLYKLDNDSSELCLPIVCFAMRVMRDMSVIVWINNIRLEPTQLHPILGHTQNKLTLWSQLHNLLVHYAKHITAPDVTSKCRAISVTIEELGDTIQQPTSCIFLSEQVNLLCSNPNGRRYSVDMIINAFSLYHRII